MLLYTYNVAAEKLQRAGTTIANKKLHCCSNHKPTYLITSGMETKQIRFDPEARSGAN